MRRLARENMMRFLAFIVLLALVFGMCAGGSSARVYADTGGELNYDKVNILGDLLKIGKQTANSLYRLSFGSRYLCD